MLAYIMDTTEREDLLRQREPGVYDMTLTLPKPLLKPGLYSIDIYYTAQRSPSIQSYKDCIQFEVMLLSKEEMNAGYAKNRAGIIAINPSITLTKAIL